MGLIYSRHRVSGPQKASEPQTVRWQSLRAVLSARNGSLALLATCLLASCSNNASEPPTPESAHNVLWDWAWDVANDEQREAMADGEVTFAEYEAAALRTVQCLNEIGHGVRGEARFSESTGEYQLGARWELGPGETSDSPIEEERSEAVERCDKEHWAGIRDAWGAQNQPSEQELNEARQALAECLREAGATVPAPASQEDLSGLQGHPAYFSCSGEVSDQYGISNFGG